MEGITESTAQGNKEASPGLTKIEKAHSTYSPYDIQLLNLLITLHHAVKHWLSNKQLTQDATAGGRGEGAGEEKQWIKKEQQMGGR